MFRCSCLCFGNYLYNSRLITSVKLKYEADDYLRDKLKINKNKKTKMNKFFKKMHNWLWEYEGFKISKIINKISLIVILLVVITIIGSLIWHIATPATNSYGDGPYPLGLDTTPLSSVAYYWSVILGIPWIVLFAVIFSLNRFFTFLLLKGKRKLIVSVITVFFSIAVVGLLTMLSIITFLIISDQLGQL